MAHRAFLSPSHSPRSTHLSRVATQCSMFVLAVDVMVGLIVYCRRRKQIRYVHMCATERILWRADNAFHGRLDWIISNGICDNYKYSDALSAARTFSYQSNSVGMEKCIRKNFVAMRKTAGVKITATEEKQPAANLDGGKIEIIHRRALKNVSSERVACGRWQTNKSTVFTILYQAMCHEQRERERRQKKKCTRERIRRRGKIRPHDTEPQNKVNSFSQFHYSNGDAHAKLSVSKEATSTSRDTNNNLRCHSRARDRREEESFILETNQTEKKHQQHNNATIIYPFFSAAAVSDMIIGTIFALIST